MAHCFFVGIGGTGAKCAEALMHLSAAGLGPEFCSVMLVDQDEPNGNGERCQRIIDSYIQLRNYLADPTERSIGRGPTLFRTQIVTPPGGASWCPTSKRGTTLGEICSYALLEPELKELMDCLYLPKEREQSLDKGFRAHPSVGAAVLLSQTLEGDKFWQSVFASIDDARRGEEIRIFILGSIFGGTGAAGLPTIARLIRRAIMEKIGRGVKIGGALMLPYFYFPPPPRQTDELLPDSSAFLEQTQGSLTYYYRLFTEQKLFDNLYLIGWQPLLEINGYCEGGRQQRNPALIPELYAGLAALRFFAAEDTDGDPVTYFGTSEGGAVTWSDLPQVRPPNRTEIRNSFGGLIRFAHAYHNVYRPALMRERWRAIQREVWFRRLIGPDGTILADPRAQELLELMDSYCEDLLRWTANMVFGGAGTVDDVKLCNVSQFARLSNDPFERAELSASRDLLRSFGALIEGEEGLDLPMIFDRLTYDRFSTGSKGPAVFMKALHQACTARP